MFHLIGTLVRYSDHIKCHTVDAVDYITKRLEEGDQ